MSPTYAADTQVSSDRSRAEIERTLQRFGADAFMYGWEAERAMVQFRAHGRYVKFELPMPDREEFALTPARGKRRSDSQIEAAYEQAVRQRWRALNLVIKAKLEAVEANISTFESEFLANVVLPNGETVGQWVMPQVDLAYEQGSMPKLLPAGS